jgi:hypothetical protein
VTSPRLRGEVPGEARNLPRGKRKDKEKEERRKRTIRRKENDKEER